MCKHKEKFKFRLSGTYNVVGKPAENIYNLLVSNNMFHGNMWASWCESDQVGYIKVACREISMTVELQHLKRDEFLSVLATSINESKADSDTVRKVYNEVLSCAKNYDYEESN